MKHARKMVFGRYDYASFLTFIAYAAGSVVVPVSLVSLARELGFQLERGGLAAGGALHLGRTLAMVVSLLLCGFWAGRWGKRRSLGIAVLLMGLGMGLCALAPAYGFVFLALLVAGLGEGVIEGLCTPFVQDLHPEEPGRYINFSHAFWSIGVLVTVLLTGALLSQGISWRLITGGVSVLALLPALLLLGPERPEHAYPEQPQTHDRATVWRQMRSILRIPCFWRYFAAMFVAGGGEFCITFWCASYLQLHFAASAWIGGVGTACFAGGMVLGRTCEGYWLRQKHLKSLIVASALAGTAITLCLPLATSSGLFLLLLFLSGIATAPFWPSIQSHSADRIPQVDTTMLFILLACAGVPGCGVATWAMGCLGNQSGGLGRAFYLIPACYLLLALLIGSDGRKEPR
ncbi:MAG: putative sialic acid transporter [Chthonomonadaceae bacterium]|nr:putative sialic acid transporter [Chthonomonadaceae bacterium]